MNATFPVRILAAAAFATVLTAAPASAQGVAVDANDVVINGESFFAASNIRDELNRLARRDSVIGQAESFRQVAVSGALIEQILGYYMNAEPKPKYLISDGGGNDLMGSCPSGTADCPVVASTIATARAYFDSMAAHGTEKVLWMRYPDPQGSQWATLKSNQDLYNPVIKDICDTIQTPKCLWIDLRPVWEDHYAEYTSDGIHATDAGGTATAEAFWKVIVDSAFFGGTVTGVGSREEAGPRFRVASGSSGITVRVAETGPHVVGIHDAAGRLLARRSGRGTAVYRFASFGSAANAGLYFVRVEAGGRQAVRKVLAGRRAAR